MLIPVTVAADDVDTAIAVAARLARVDGYPCTGVARTQWIGRSTWRIIMVGEENQC